ncbi:hypothetical protein HW49_03850 [Porphyromonadaceae bacterium COT-184 OH4590]|nr:hypothetical protein HW49_03850 [Porphyromonadaceae bacterium COT-184 OH4590]
MTKFIINAIAFLGVLLWFLFDPSWESGSSCGIAFAALLSQFFWNDSVKKIIRKNKTVFHHNSQNRFGSMNQTAGKNSTQYQSGGNMTINK